MEARTRGGRDRDRSQKATADEAASQQAAADKAAADKAKMDGLVASLNVAIASATIDSLPTLESALGKAHAEWS